MTVTLFLLLTALTDPAEAARENSLGEIMTALHKAEQEDDAESAVKLFEQLASRGVASGRFYLCQGNAYLRAGRLAEAIVAYRRAEHWLPRDSRLHANLVQARSLVLEPPSPVREPTLPVWFRLSQREVRILALLFWVVGWSLAAVATVRYSWGWTVAAIVVLVLSGAGATAVQWQEYDWSLRPEAVVTRNGVTLREGNGTSYPPHERNGLPIVLNAGVEVRVLSERPNGWAKVQLDNGETGWVPRGELLFVWLR
jgi:hypothetical protein